EMARIKRSVSSLPATTDEMRPNIIFLQLESFMDPLEVDYLTCSEDPIPIFRKLMKDYSSGYYRVPSVGAGTANSEFESITGMSLHYFGPGEYPYKSILQESTCESIPYVLKSLGYSTHAIHNNEANFYARRTVFPKLGFDTFTSAEYMPREDEKTPLGWIRDEILTEEILKCLTSTEDQEDYVYCISVQGHGDYPEEPVLEEPLITVSGSATPEQDCKWEYYVNQVKEMDNFVGELVKALSEYPEDVVLVMYGDHLPTMGLTVEDLKNRYLFQTTYVIWDNMGLPKKKENLATYQMGAEILRRLDIHEGTLVRFHQARRNSKNYQVDLEMLQYDMLYGKKYCYEEGTNPFKPTKMRLGLVDVTLDGIELVSESNYTYYVKGTNFTPSSQVKLNGDWVDTIYLSETMLLISGTQLDAFDRLSVVQRSNSSTRKALTKSYDRAYYMLDENSVWNVNKLKK
ncbi:MAG: LTA synthase family protein, partial [Blautia sp.]|nr:LTA synthase family protein [Blautia sp.]